MPGRFASRPSRASAGGHDEHPWLVKSSTTQGLSVAAAGVALPAPAASIRIAASTAAMRRAVPGPSFIRRTLPETGLESWLKTLSSGSQLSEARPRIAGITRFAAQGFATRSGECRRCGNSRAHRKYRCARARVPRVSHRSHRARLPRSIDRASSRKGRRD